MFNSSTLNNAILSSSPIFNLDNTQEDPLYPLTSYYYLPSPLIYNEIDYFGDFLSHHHDPGSFQPQALKAASSAITDDSSILMGPNKGEETVNGVVEDGHTIKRPSASHGSRRRRTSKKDRHSKINTAQGLRDRRMRLSLEVARPFFKLQDMLGYDKASRTVEWLLLQSKPAIEELLLLGSKNTSPSGVTTTKCTMSPTSDCEVESITIQDRKGNNYSKTGKRSSSSGAKDIIKPKQLKRKRTTKESRIEARARARKRTLERKLCSIELKDGYEYPDNSNSRANWGALEMLEGYNDSNSQTHKGNNHPIEGDWNSLTTFSYHQNGEISQSAPSYRVSMQQNIMGGPQ